VAAQIDKQGRWLSEIAGRKTVPHNDEALMDFGLVILPPARLTASGGFILAGGRFTQESASKQPRAAMLRACPGGSRVGLI
jgi:hypothetical protein